MRTTLPAGFPKRFFSMSYAPFFVFSLAACGDLSPSNESSELANHPFADDPAWNEPLRDEGQLDEPPFPRGKFAENGEESHDNLLETLGDLQDYIKYQKSRKALNGTVGTVGIFGGFSTCTKSGPFGSQIYDRTLKMLWQKARKGEFYRVVATCFAKSGKYVYYVSSSDLKTIRWGAPSEIVTVLKYEASLSNDTSVYMFGHSYGGWLALRTTLDLPNAINVKGLATIDPISRTYCTPGAFTSAYFSSMFSFNPSPDCTRSPRDFTLSDTAKIKNRTGWWHNFYQDNDGFIHSSHMGNASNKYIDYNYTGVFDIGRAHMEIDNDERVWSVFEPKI